MPHKCLKCGKEYDEKSPELFSGCRECGSRKFYFIGELSRTEKKVSDDIRRPVLKKRGNYEYDNRNPVNERAEIIKDRTHSPIESIRIIEPGSYELNIHKLVESDDRVVRLNDEGSYMLDLISMVHPKERKKWF